MDDDIPDFFSTSSAENSDNEDNAKQFSSESEKSGEPSNESKIQKKTSKSNSVKKYSLQIYNQGDKGQYRCDICDFMSCKVTGLASHMIEHSENNIEKNTNEENPDETSQTEGRVSPVYVVKNT